MSNIFVKSLKERKEDLERELELIVLERFLDAMKKRMDFDSWKKLQQMVESGESSDEIEKFLQSKVENYQDLLQNIIDEIGMEKIEN